MGLLSNVTAAFLAKALPFRTVPVPSEMDENARMFPTNVEPVPSVAELPTCQKTLAALAPLIRTTLLLFAVVSPLAIWKRNWAFALPWASSVRVPVIPSVDVDI
jgi:hypothetical protein